MSIKQQYIDAVKKCQSGASKSGQAEFNACNSAYHAYAHVEDNTVYIAPTTSHIKDIVMNFLVYPSLFVLPIAGLHAGFAAIAMALYPKIIRHLDKDRPVHLYGYSQGGAVALILSHWFSVKGYKVRRVVTFASPRPYSWLYQLIRHIHPAPYTVNYVVRGDLIPFCPPWMTRAGKVVRLGKIHLPWIAHPPATMIEHLNEMRET